METVDHGSAVLARRDCALPYGTLPSGGLPWAGGERKESLHVAVVQRLYTLRKGGAERYSVNLCRSLRRLGHQVTVVGEWLDPALRHETCFVAVPVNRITSWTKNRSFARTAQDVFCRQEFDVSLGLGLVPGVDVARATGRIHAHWLHVRGQGAWRQRLHRFNPRDRAILELEHALYASPRGAKRVIAQSLLEQRLLWHYYAAGPDRTRVIRNGVDTTTFHPGLRRDGEALRGQLGIPHDVPLLVFAAAGNLPEKGLRTCLLAIREMERRDARLLVLGSGGLTRFRMLVAAWGLSKRVRFLGVRPAVERFFAAADLLMLPTEYEPFPNVNLEAFACGTPVVTTASCGGADIVVPGKNGYLIQDAHATEELVDQVNRHFRLGQSRRMDMALHCWRTARALSPERNARQVAELLREVSRVKADLLARQP